VSPRSKSIHPQFEDEVVVIEGIANVRQNGWRERWNWQLDFSLAILYAAARLIGG